MTGLVVGAPQTYQYFNRIQDQIVSFRDETFEDFKAAVPRLYDGDGRNRDATSGTVVYGPETVESGLMDQLGSLSDAFAWLHRQIAKEKKKK